MKTCTQVSSETASHRTPIFQRARATALATNWILFALATALIFSLCSIIHATSLPPNYTETQVAGGLANPVAMEFAPDGRLFVSEQAGKVRVIKNGALLATPFVDLTGQVDSSGERGVVGIAFDPNFSVNHYVYIYYTAKSPASHNRVSRFTATGDVAVAGSEVVIFELNNLSASTFHNGGAIHFGLDGKLYIASGDANISDNADSFQNLLGKILRINADGSIPSDNPFYNTTSGNNRAIWVLGLRNPYSFAVQPGTGRIFINDVGENTWEEINDGIAGSHYGWPLTEGPTSNPNYRSPFDSYQHGSFSSGGCAITGGTFYNPSVQQFPLAFNGSYFYADYCGGWIRMLEPASADKRTIIFATDIAAPVDLKVGPEGSLYYLARGTSSNTGTVVKITYGGTQVPPPQDGGVYLSDLTWVSATNGWGPVELDQSNGELGSGDGHPITLDGLTYAKGLGVHAASEIIYNLEGKYSSFLADIGIDDEASFQGSVTFEVWADGVKLYQSGMFSTNSPTAKVNVSVQGRQQLRLVVTDGGDGNTADHADWAIARVIKTSAQAPLITQQPASQSVSQGQSATFTVGVSGTAPFTYQWQRNGVNIGGANSASYTLASTSASDNGARFRVVVSNSSGSATSNEAVLTVGSNRPPTATITWPEPQFRYRAGDFITFTGTATDPEDGELPASAYTWEVVFHHDTHTHPFWGPISGNTYGTIQLATSGETSANVWYRIHLTVKDSAGATTTVFRDVLLQTSNLSFATSPAGLQITLDGQPRITPLTVESVVRLTRTLGVVSPQTVNGTTYYFSGWSDGTPTPTRTITTPETNTSYTAIFTTQNPSPTPTPTPAPTPTPTTRTPVTLTDDFNDNARDTARWNLGIISKPASGFDSQVNVTERNQRLEITPRVSVTGNHYNGYVTASLFDLTGGSVSVEVGQATNSAANTIFAIALDNANGYRFVIEDGHLFFQQLGEPPASTQFGFSVVYNAALHRFWRFRHEAAFERMVFETSADGINWNIMRYVPGNITLSNVRAELSAGTFTPISTPGTAIFDNFKLQGFTSSASTTTAVGFRFDSDFLTESIFNQSTLIVERIGDATTAFTVDYATSDDAGTTPCQTSAGGNASGRCDYLSASGTLRFAPGEVRKTILIPVIDDYYAEPTEIYHVSLFNPQGASLNVISTMTIRINDNDPPDRTDNPLDNQQFFIHQQYIDFLGRLPDFPGYAFWNERMENCPAGQICDRIDTSQRFFQSDEFQERGFYVYRLYDAVLGRLPHFTEFMPEVGRLNGPQTVQEQRQGKDAYLLSFINKTEFRNLYGQYLTSDGTQATNAAGFVNALIARAGITPASRQTLINNLQSGARTPAQTLEDFILTPELSSVGTKFYDRGFITMQYFGYLRRDPEQAGFDFWVGQLMGANAPHRQDYRFMVGGFLNSDEYRFRFARVPAR